MPKHSTRQFPKLLTITAVVAGLVVSAGAVASTSAAYTDQAFTKSDTLVADLEVPMATGLAKFRSVDTAGGVGTDGNVYLWGWLNWLRGNSNNAGSTGRNGPTKVQGLPEGRISAVSGQIYDANALDMDGYVWGWGYHGLRNGVTNSLSDRIGTPQRLRIGGVASDSSKPLLDRIGAITTSEMAGAGIREDGLIFKWGYDWYGGSNGSGAEKVAGLPDPLANNGEKFPIYIQGGYNNIWTILNNGEVWYWGSTINTSLPAADERVSSRTVATKSAALSPWFKSNVAAGKPYIVQLAGGIAMGQALLSNGQVLTWGSTSYRTGNRGGTATVPAINPHMSNIAYIAAGFTGMIALDNSGNVVGFGASDDYGFFPMQPAIIANGVTDVTAGQGYYIWRKTDGSSWVQGYNPQGALGLPIGNKYSPTRMSWDLSILG